MFLLLRVYIIPFSSSLQFSFCTVFRLSDKILFDKAALVPRTYYSKNYVMYVHLLENYLYYKIIFKLLLILSRYT